MPRLKSHGTAKDSSSRRWLLVKAKGEKIQAGRVSIAANGLGGILSALKRSENVMGSKCLTLTHDHDACQVYEHASNLRNPAPSCFHARFGGPKCQIQTLAFSLQDNAHTCGLGNLCEGRRAPVASGTSHGPLLNELACGNIDRDFHNVSPQHQLTGNAEP